MTKGVKAAVLAGKPKAEVDRRIAHQVPLTKRSTRVAEILLYNEVPALRGHAA
jgi:hypothetical protein